MEYYESIKPEFQQWIEHYSLQLVEKDNNPNNVTILISDPQNVLTNDTIESIVVNILRKTTNLYRKGINVKKEHRVGGVLIGLQEANSK